MKKKSLAFLFIASMLISITACGKSEEVENEPVEEVQAQAEVEEPVEEEKVINAEITDEDYFYACILDSCICAPYSYWEVWGDRNITENNEFAIVDIDSDGTKELLVKFDSHAVSSADEYKKICVYQDGKVTNSVFADNAEFYCDGTIFVDYIFDSGERDISFYLNNEMIAYAYILDKDIPNDLYYEEHVFPDDKDADGDGIIYVWNDWKNNFPTEDVYLTEDEYNTKVTEMLAGKEKVDIDWNYITKESISHTINPALSDEDINFFEALPSIKVAMETECISSIFDNEYNIEEFMGDYFFCNNRNIVDNKGKEYKDYFDEVLPSTKLINEDFEELTFQVKVDEIKRLYKEGLNRDITDHEIPGNIYQDESGNNVVNYIIDTISLVFNFDILPLSIEKQEDTLIINGVCYYTIDYDNEYGIKFSCILKENENSPLDGYTVLDCSIEKLFTFDPLKKMSPFFQ